MRIIDERLRIAKFVKKGEVSKEQGIRDMIRERSLADSVLTKDASVPGVCVVIGSQICNIVCDDPKRDFFRVIPHKPLVHFDTMEEFIECFKQDKEG
jgi:hypothetical protein